MELLKEKARDHWTTALGGRVLVQDDTDYFSSGGHSFMATMIIARLNAEFGLELELRILFDNPIFASFVDAVAAEIAATRNPRSDARN